MTSLLPDEEIDNATEFGFADYSKALASVIRNPDLQTPFTIAIHGDWGSGKTSLMKTVAKELSEESEEFKVKTVWFDAWEFEKLPLPLWSVFLSRIALELRELVPEPGDKEKLESLGKNLLTISANLALRKLVGVSLQEAKQLAESTQDDIPQIETLREELSRHVKSALESNGGLKRIVVFVDDLDRCLPEQAVETFESIKLFLGCEGCVFVIGMDKEQVRKAFETTYKEKAPAGTSYLDKFIQLPFDLPRKTPSEVEQFLESNVSPELAENAKTLALIARFIEPNPRKIKRWINSVTFLEELFRIKQNKILAGGEPFDPTMVSIWMFLKSFFPDFASRVEREPQLLNLAVRVTKGAGTDEDKKRMGDFTLDRELSGFLAVLKDSYPDEVLRDVIYLSRLTPSTQNVSTLPEDVFERILAITPEELDSQLAGLDGDARLLLVVRVARRLTEQASKYSEYSENVKYYQLIDKVWQLSRGASRVHVLEEVLEFVSKSRLASWFFESKLKSYLSFADARTMIIEKKYLPMLVELFTGSWSFESAKNLSGVLLYFSKELTKEQLERIVGAVGANEQVSQSWGAQANLEELFAQNKRRIVAEHLIWIRETYHWSV